MRFIDAYAILLLDEKKGHFFDLGVGGAIILDLFVAQRISIVPNKKPKRKAPAILVQEGNPTGDAILDETIQILRDSKGIQTLRHAVIAASKQHERFLDVIYTRLEEEGIVRTEVVEKFFGYKKNYFLLKPELKQPFLNDVLTFGQGSGEPGFFQLALISLLENTNLLKELVKGQFEKQDWRAFNQRYNQYVNWRPPREPMAGNMFFINELYRTIFYIISSKTV